ncbi:MAG: 50S ribosomal protein L13 [Weeksellaceae bacterium]
MDTLSYKTISVNKANADKQWLLVDAEGQNLGRVASKIAKLLRGKHKTNFTPHADCGDYVVVVNADKINLTGNKWQDKVYQRYTGFPGGQRTQTAMQLHKKDANKMMEHAVKGMLPKNKLGRKLFKNMKVYSGEVHEHDAQQPRKIDINEFK